MHGLAQDVQNIVVLRTAFLFRCSNLHNKMVKDPMQRCKELFCYYLQLFRDRLTRHGRVQKVLHRFGQGLNSDEDIDSSQLRVSCCIH
ncbi:hypothetical protein KC19_5G201300, partial [Ceratodon purpureus]